jgi:hypothetical protein
VHFVSGLERRQEPCNEWKRVRRETDSHISYLPLYFICLLLVRLTDNSVIIYLAYNSDARRLVVCSGLNRTSVYTEDRNVPNKYEFRIRWIIGSA